MMTIENVILMILLPIMIIAIGTVWKKANANCDNLTKTIQALNDHKLQVQKEFVPNRDFEKLERQVSEIHDIIIGKFGTAKIKKE
ncbi:MAG: hypothetical protein LBN27_05055 [Prevotellaceae bacterium]|nr:hypothetical protein [Prevotellaceae bacterium]